MYFAHAIKEQVSLSLYDFLFPNRPLPAELIKYAREDTHYLLYIYDKLKLELLEQGNNQNNLVVATIDRSTQVCAKVRNQMFYVSVVCRF